jgi:1,4-dihydroxy-2-naphthoate octaprenyltransferase
MLAGKHTLATVIGLFASRILYVLLMLGAYAIIVYLGLPHEAPHLILLSLWTLPTLAVAIISAMRTNAPAGFHLVMRLTLLLEIYFTFLLMIGLIITTFIPILLIMPLNFLKL